MGTRMDLAMPTRRKPKLEGGVQTRPGENLDSGKGADERTVTERAREGRSRKASDNASDRTPPKMRRNSVR